MNHGRILIRALLASTLLLSPFGCKPAVAPAPPSVRRIAVLPPADEGARGAPPTATERSLADVLAAAARDELAHQGFEVVDPMVVRNAARGEIANTPEAAANIVTSAGLDATPLLIRLHRWEYDRPTMRTDRIIAALDVSLVDPRTGRVLWETRRAAAPVQLHGALLAGQADVVAAEEVMREMLSGVGTGRGRM